MALKAQGRTTDEIGHKSMLGVYGGILGCVINFLLIAGEIYVSLFPLGDSPSAEAFFQYCLSIPIMIVVYFCHRLYRRNWRDWLIPASQIDLDTGKRVSDLELLKHEIMEEKAKVAARPLYYRIYRFWC